MLNGTVYPPTLNSRRHFPTADETRLAKRRHILYFFLPLSLLPREILVLAMAHLSVRHTATSRAVAELHVIMTNNTDPFSPVTQQLTYTS